MKSRAEAAATANRLRFAAIALLSASICPRVAYSFSAALSVPELLKSADQVCVGRLRKVPPPAGHTAEREYAAVLVDHMIKGMKTKHAVISWARGHRTRFSISAEKLSDDRYLLFLATTAPAESQLPVYELIRALRVSKTAPENLTAASTPPDRVERELVLTITKSHTTTAWWAIRALGTMGSVGDGTIEVLRKTSSHQEPLLASQAIASRIRLGDKTAVQEALRLAKSDGSSRGKYTGFASAIRRLRFSSYRTEILGFLTSPNVAFRQAASYVIRQGNDPGRRDLPVLAQLLDDPDLRVRYNAVMGMAKRLGRSREWAPSFERFKEDPDSFAGRWRRWWLEHVSRGNSRDTDRNDRNRREPSPRPSPDALREPERDWREARAAEKMGQRAAASALYGRIVKEYPGTSFARRAKERLDSLDSPDR